MIASAMKPLVIDLGGVAYQRVIRDREASMDTGDLWGKYWESIDLNISNSQVREISPATASKIIEKYEWLGTMPAIVLSCFGIFFEDLCAGAVVYSPEYTENLGVWDKYGYTNKIILLARGACVHWAHPHSASRLIRASMKLLPERYRVVTCTVDGEAGEIGTIYQACGFDYVGQMSKGGARASFVQSDGTRLSGRQLGRMHGSRGVDRLTAMGVKVESVPRKQRYFGFRGKPKEVQELRSTIQHLIKPYPKRCQGGVN